ncbi:MAG: Ig-like domain-containing protein [Pseudomonadota bacterium]
MRISFLPFLPVFLTFTAPACMKLPETAVEQQDRPPLFVTWSNIEDLQEDVPINMKVKLTFNQPLDPGSLADTEITLESGGLTIGGRKKYDLMSRTLAFEPQASMRSNLWYKFVLKNAPFSIMGTSPQQDEINILFKTGDRISDDDPPAPPIVDFETGIYPVLSSSNCRCHATFHPMMGAQFVFAAPGEFLEGAVATESREWSTWKIIDPGRPEKSYLMYKLLGDERLGLPTITGERMPPGGLEDDERYGDLRQVPIETIETIGTWINQGAGSGR